MASLVRAFFSVSVLAASLAGCGQASHTLAPAASNHSVAAFDTGIKTKEQFLAAVKKAGIKLTDKDVEMLTVERHVTPSGAFAPRPAENLTADQNLDVHFKKHGHEFSPPLAVAGDYVGQGIAAGTGKRGEVKFMFDTTSFEKGYQTHIVRWVPTTKDFCAFRADGAMTTYYRNFSVSPKRFIEVPALQ